MGLFSTPPPSLPDASEMYSRITWQRFVSALRVYFSQLNAVQNISIASLNINLDSLPTDADVATLRSGDVYCDTTASNVLKIKV